VTDSKPIADKDHWICESCLTINKVPQDKSAPTWPGLLALAMVLTFLAYVIWLIVVNVR
jgi:hypothetical protein